ncbi:MAG: dihydrodipicolinate synthase family protein [Bryobacterales bacterium]|nr:dihydrodipicolinate synthase family protein [Bryobacterales bacterium]
MKLQGIFPPLATPFHYDGSLYRAKMFHNVEKWNKTALPGYVVCGSAGESVMLTTEEKLDVWGWVAQAAGTGKLLIAGTGVESVRETVWLTNKAAEMGYKAAMARTPHYYKWLLNRDEPQLMYFRAVADQARIPIIICNSPLTTGVDISPAAVAQLSEHPNIIAIRENSADIGKVMELVRTVNKGFHVLTGSASTLWPSLQVGAAGAAPAFANAAPYACITIWEAHRTREYEAARDWQDRIALAARLTARYGVPGLKYAMDRNGYYGGPPRLPLTVIGPEAKREIADAFAEIRG